MKRFVFLVCAVAACGKPTAGTPNEPPAFAGATALERAPGSTDLVVRWAPATDDATRPEDIRYRVVLAPRYAARALRAGWTPPADSPDVVVFTTAEGATEQRLPMPDGAAWRGACCVARVRALDAERRADDNAVVVAAPDAPPADPAACAAKRQQLATLERDARAALAAQLDDAIADVAALRQDRDRRQYREYIKTYLDSERAGRDRGRERAEARRALVGAVAAVEPALARALATPAGGAAFVQASARAWQPKTDALLAEVPGIVEALSADGAAVRAAAAAYEEALQPRLDRHEAWAAVDLLASTARRVADRRHSHTYFVTLQRAYARMSEVAQAAYEVCDDEAVRDQLRATAHFQFIDDSLETLSDAIGRAR